ncbi:unnamed protein product [Euphydryas editha]|uniref:Peptidase aspartic putative domain-containing protein n=1 Tax=Euphydryas editha TaxID=104508 RepID=A0AAU9V517_EUPED|nr:unnamed protein product [Euphydryas editha]
MESASHIKQLLDTTVTCLKALTNMGIDSSSWDIIINYLVISKLDSESMRQWEQHISVKSELPTWSELQLYLESRFRSLEMIECNNNKNKSLLAKSIPKTKSFHTNLHTPEWSDIEALELADPGYTTPGRIDILLGAEVYSNVLLSGIMKHPTINLLAQNTIFGWVLSGKICNQHLSARNTVSILHIQLKDDDILKLFWEQENEPNTIERRLSKEEERCEEIY